MKQEIQVPAMGESVTEAIIAEWLKKDGDYVNRNEPVVVLESDKANFEVIAEAAGTLSQAIEEGETVSVGAVVGHLDTSAEAPAASEAPAVSEEESSSESAPAPEAPASSQTPDSTHPDLKESLSPSVQRVVAEKGLDPKAIEGSGRGGRLTKADALQATPGQAAPQSQEAPAPAPKEKAPIPDLPQAAASDRGERRVKMTTLRKRIAQRLVEAQHTAAILTTFNEIDMTELFALRARYKEDFKEHHGVSLGFMGFFTKAVCEALKFVPEVNAFIEDEEVVYHDACHIGVAVGTPKGLVVPVVRDADLLTLAEIEQSIRHYALKARDGKIAIDDLQGGNFTISNGGVYGSLMSTPILNPPQSGILGMHKVEDRPVVMDGQVVVRPMMYVALSYDHRIIDGKEAVTFLVKVKEFLEDPARLLLKI